MNHSRCVSTLFIQGVNISSYTHKMYKRQIAVAFVVKKYLVLGNEATEPFLSSLLSRVYAPVWSPAGMSNIRNYSLLRAEREVKILLSVYKGVNTVWHLITPNFHMALSMWISSLSGWWQKMIRAPCLSLLPCFCEKQWFERGRLKCLV